MRILTISLATVAALALSSTFATTQARMTGPPAGHPPHASTTGLMNRSSVASMHGANRRGFCPPGQHKKPGMGSAFHC
jgi:hypothetical protein